MKIFKKFIRNLWRHFAGTTIGGVHVFPITTKITLIFILFILLSNFSSHYLSLLLYRGEMVRLQKQLLVKDLRDVYLFSNTQNDIYTVNGDIESAKRAIENKAKHEFKKKRSLLLGIFPEGKIFLYSSKQKQEKQHVNHDVLTRLNSNLVKGVREGFISFTFNNETYFGVYKYNIKWKAFLIRGEEFNEFYEESRNIFNRISLIIIAITMVCAVIGVYIMRYILRFIWIITAHILEMVDTQELKLIPLKGAQSDDITFLGIAFNSLSSLVHNLLGIFQKFTTKDIVDQAYIEHEVRLEGQQRELTCLFTDIKSFTSMTEILGTEIITLLNIHYTNVINEIHKHEGIVGSIIGDALLAVYGVMGKKEQKRKSYQAVLSGYAIHRIAVRIRKEMMERKNKLLEEKEVLTPEEEKVFQSVSIDVGVGIDGGLIFYGNIGSHERMTSTVIGDNVNSASRLEGLNRIYKIPVLCSEYIKKDIEANIENHNMIFIELDTVCVKGKSDPKKIYWPILKKRMTDRLLTNLTIYSEALQLFYNGQWKMALRKFRTCSLPASRAFISRIKTTPMPENWNGVWILDSK